MNPPAKYRDHDPLARRDAVLKEFHAPGPKEANRELSAHSPSHLTMNYRESSVLLIAIYSSVTRSHRIITLPFANAILTAWRICAAAAGRTWHRSPIAEASVSLVLVTSSWANIVTAREWAGLMSNTAVMQVKTSLSENILKVKLINALISCSSVYYFIAFIRSLLLLQAFLKINKVHNGQINFKIYWCNCMHS